MTGIPQLLAQALPVVADLAGGLRENAGQLVDAGIQFILNLATGLMNGLPTMITYLPGIVSDIAGIINDNAPKLLAAGVQLVGFHAVQLVGHRVGHRVVGGLRQAAVRLHFRMCC